MTSAGRSRLRAALIYSQRAVISGPECKACGKACVGDVVCPIAVVAIDPRTPRRFIVVSDLVYQFGHTPHLRLTAYAPLHCGDPGRASYGSRTPGDLPRCEVA